MGLSSANDRPARVGLRRLLFTIGSLSAFALLPLEGCSQSEDGRAVGSAVGGSAETVSSTATMSSGGAQTGPAGGAPQSGGAAGGLGGGGSRGIGASGGRAADGGSAGTQSFGGTAASTGLSGAAGTAGSDGSGVAGSGGNGVAGSGGSAGTAGSTASSAGPAFAAVLSVFSLRCTFCHQVGGIAVPGNTSLHLTADLAYAELVGKPAQDTCGGILVAPGNSAQSYLIHKLTDLVPCAGPRMPMAYEAPFMPLTTTQLTTIRTWIDQGAPP